MAFGHVPEMPHFLIDSPEGLDWPLFTRTCATRSQKSASTISTQFIGLMSASRDYISPDVDLTSGVDMPLCVPVNEKCSRSSTRQRENRRSDRSILPSLVIPKVEGHTEKELHPSFLSERSKGHSIRFRIFGSTFLQEPAM